MKVSRENITYEDQRVWVTKGDRFDIKKGTQGFGQNME
jgi:hypothetical protein